MRPCPVLLVCVCVCVFEGNRFLFLLWQVSITITSLNLSFSTIPFNEKHEKDQIRIFVFDIVQTKIKKTFHHIHLLLTREFWFLAFNRLAFAKSLVTFNLKGVSFHMKKRTVIDNIIYRVRKRVFCAESFFPIYLYKWEGASILISFISQDDI